MNEMMNHGLVLMGMGMGVVFVVLGAIYLGIVALGWMDAKWPEPAREYDVPKPKRPSAQAGGPTEEERAAIKAALAHHLGMGPDEFDVRFK